MKVHVIQTPYDSGHENVRSGRGPEYLVEKGICREVEKSGHPVILTRIYSDRPLHTEIGTTFDVIEKVAAEVGATVALGSRPLLLAGNCNHTVGAIAGLGRGTDVGLVWFDAHGDFNTPETTVTGFLDGMGLAMTTGRCWGSLTGSIPGFEPVLDDHIIHVGSLDLDAAEREMFENAGIPLVTRDRSDETRVIHDLETALSALRNRVTGLYLHIDLDFFQVAQGQPNHLSVPGGLPLHIAEDAVRTIKRSMPVLGCTIASYDPEYDTAGHVVKGCFALIDRLLGE